MKSKYFQLFLGAVFYLLGLAIILKKGIIHNYDLMITIEGNHLLLFGIIIGAWMYSFITFSTNVIYKKGEGNA